MKKVIIVLVVVLVAVGAWFYFNKKSVPIADEKVFVAVEGEGKIVVLDPKSGNTLDRIDLSTDFGGTRLMFSPHNVQVAPNGNSVWVTANLGMQDHSSSRIIPEAHAHGDEGAAQNVPDEVIVINPTTDEIVKRIPLAHDAHLAHVVVSADSKFAYVSAQDEGAIYVLDAQKLEVIKKIPMPDKSEPHGIRLSPDGKTLYIAFVAGKALGRFDTASDRITQVPLTGRGIQTGITPDGAYAVASEFDSKALAIYEVASQKLRYAKLPDDAKGPIQMYPTPDSKFMYVADQGKYYGAAAGDSLYKVDLASGSVVKKIKVGGAPHGVVVSRDGAFVYVTNVDSGDVSVIDTSRDEEVKKIPVGKEPNGISYWSKMLGGTP